MKNRILFLIITAFIVIVPFPSHSEEYTVQVETLHAQTPYPAGGKYPILFRLEIQKPWYIHGPHEEEFIFPTELSFGDTSKVKVKKITFPDPDKVKFPYREEPVEVYSGSILVQATIVVGKKTPEGEAVIKGKLAYQACTDKVCEPPDFFPISVSLDIAPKGASVTPLNQEIFIGVLGEKNAEEGFSSTLEAGFLLGLIGIFLGGLALNLTPCIYPLIPITVSYFSGRSQIAKTSAVLHGLLYILGLSLTNSLLGVSAALSGGILGSALQNPFVLIFVAGIMIALGLSFFELYEFRLPVGWTNFAVKTYQGYFGTLFMGLTLGIVAAPCLGPFILGLLTYVGQQGDPLLGFIYFFTLSVGMGLPLATLGVFSGAVNKLPMSGDWMVWIRKFMGWVLIGMAAHVINPLLSGNIAKAVPLTAVIVAAGIHLGWLDRAGVGRRNFMIFKKAFGTFLVVGAIAYVGWVGIPRHGILWVPYDEDYLAEAAKKKKPVILDFYADWCDPCRAMDRKVFSDSQVVELSENLVTMRLDLTHKQRYHKKVLLKYRIRGVPSVLFFNRDGAEEKDLRIEFYIGKNEFLKRMKKLLEQSSSPRT